MRAILIYIFEIFVCGGSALALFNPNSTSKGTALLPPGTCNAELPFSESGFDVCFFGSTGTLASTLVELAGNAGFNILHQLDLGNCYCNQKCKPSQIVCEDGKPSQYVFGNIGLSNLIAEFIYAAENYNFYCFCPEQISAEEACKHVENPEVCKPPTAK